ncbi:hypothetical protein P692DRAFT_20876928 [Suillus brevipes Sb2]|nr:hypothetical protein P692DRAFT_20876928 [Suillus brevipes Sb2]
MVLNPFEHVDELLAKKSYSDRPVPIMLGELMGLGQLWIPMQSKGYSSLQAEAVIMCLDSLVENPSNFMSQLRLAAGHLFDAQFKHSPTGFKIKIAMHLLVRKPEARE